MSMYNKITTSNNGKKWFFALSLFFFFAISVQAQRIAYVDLNKILDEMPEYQEAQKQLDNVAAQWRREIAEEYDKIKGMYSRYQAEQVLMSDDVRAQKEEEIVNKEKQVREMQKSKFGPEGALFKKRQELVRPLQEKVYTTIEDFAADKGFDFIFDKSGNAGMIFSNERYDKTQDIMDELGI